MSRLNSRIPAVVLIAVLSAAGCSKSAGTESGIGGDPASVTAIDGPGDRHQIKLSQDAADRIDLKTDTIRVAVPDRSNASGLGVPVATTQKLAVAVAAVLYDEFGVTWVYAETEPLTFVRERVAVSRVDGNVAILQSGPAAGTAVATQGAAELRGSEDGVSGE
jgi:hypothetical protein